MGIYQNIKKHGKHCKDKSDDMNSNMNNWIENHINRRHPNKMRQTNIRSRWRRSCRCNEDNKLTWKSVRGLATTRDSPSTPPSGSASASRNNLKSVLTSVYRLPSSLKFRRLEVNDEKKKKTPVGNSSIDQNWFHSLLHSWKLKNTASLPNYDILFASVENRGIKGRNV